MQEKTRERDRRVRRVILVEGSANAAVLLIKLGVGLVSGSLAVLGDAVHSLTDVSNNVVAWVIMRLSSQPPDREHPYGHRKFETLAVLGLATLLTVLAIELGRSALRREAPEIEHSGVGLALMLCVLAVNVGLATWERRQANRLDSDLLRADAHHTFADALTTVVVIAGWQLSTRGYPWVDSAGALCVAALVLYLAWGLFQRVFPILTDSLAIEPEELAHAVCAVPGVLDVHRIRSRWLGSERAVDMVVRVDAQLTTIDSHAIADRVEALLQTDFSVEDVTIHIEPHHD